MYRKLTVILFLFLSVVVQIVAQSTIRFNNFWDNMYTVNPAAINDSYLGEFSMGTRKQWVGFPGAPATIFASGTVYLEELYSQFGLKVLADKVGYTFSSDIDLSYAYAIYLNQQWQLNLGMSASFQSIGYDRSLMDEGALTDPVIADKLMKENDFNADFGFEFSHYAWRIGGSTQNFMSLFKQLNINQLHSNTNILYTQYKSNEKQFVNLGFGVAGIHNFMVFPDNVASTINSKYSNILQAEMNVTAFFKRTTETNAFQVGAFYRTWHEMGLLFGVHFDRMRIYYSYDYNVGEIYRRSLGTHEIIIAYKLNRTYKCRNCWY